MDFSEFDAIGVHEPITPPWYGVSVNTLFEDSRATETHSEDMEMSTTEPSLETHGELYETCRPLFLAVLFLEAFTAMGALRTSMCCPYSVVRQVTCF